MADFVASAVAINVLLLDFIVVMYLMRLRAIEDRIVAQDKKDKVE